MPRYRRVSSFKIMNDYKMTAKHLKYISVMANIKDRRFFRINANKIEYNIMNSKMSNIEKGNLLAMIQAKDYHKIFCYSKMLYQQYSKVYLNYKARMDDLFMTIEDKSVFYA